MDEKHQNTRQILERIKAQYQLKYGIEMDEWSAVNLADNEQRFEDFHQKLEENLLQNRVFYDTFKGSVKRITFNSRLEAFVFGLGRSVPYALSSVILGIMCYTYMTTYKDYEQILDITRRYQNLESFENLLSDGQIQTQKGTEFLVLQPSEKGGNTFGQVYEIDKSSKIVKVPLRKLK